MHDHAHPHTHTEDTSESKTKLILDYTIGHSEQHAAELKNLAERLRAEGGDEAAALLTAAGAYYEQAHENLRAALRKL